MPLLPRTLLALNETFIQVGDRPYCASRWWRFARHLAAHCQAVTIYAPLGHRNEPGDATPVELDAMRLVGRPYYRRFVEYYRRLPLNWVRVRSQARALAAEHDLVICRVPDPAAATIARAAQRAGKPLVLCVGGDVGIGLLASESGNPVVRGVGRLAAGWMRREERGVARRAMLVGVWDTQMRPRFADVCPRVEAFQSPNLTAEYLHRREDTCATRPIRLLRVCQLEPVKDFETLFDAVARLVGEGRDVTLDIAGGVTRPDFARFLEERVAALGLGRCVRFLGNVEFGPALFELYRAADIHIISSKWEGLPRCLAEARASCIPTVATAVGGIVGAIKDGEDGLLVPAGDPSALAAAVARLIDDPPLRRRIIARGFEIAPVSTAEFQARRMAERIADALASRR